ncbi:hypothetical protein DICPUDRAFT_75550 [Dictyostelium purpureum]|uniref:(d)CMP kinase n=1 Tax=Dictyostelium purpureum TaxID=5786 RepID=F0ZAZ6_DICPU|nr:uncharacterized protein DICPUDRAFT_75550 [Dictyostelium purpureum]EGC38886.1 hypothetical protein DICPUDRAFT_75550 [Dictyostelium purpureum]|eukprot:XP_003284566.1 hypothetical protein DICPUDRAFT_75550 [Dictyostelium purpureum]
MSKYNIICNQYKNYIGKNSIDHLKQLVEINKVNNTSIPCILLGGTQLTGKSTLGKNLAKHYGGGHFYSVGGFFREAAQSIGLTIAEQSRLLRIVQENLDQNSVDDALKRLGGRRMDIEMDYKTCEIIAGGDKNSQQLYKYLVIEGRQPAIMGTLLESLGREDLIKIYVTCSARERAIRFISREIGEEYAQQADKYLSNNYKSDESLSSLTNEISKLPIPSIKSIAEAFQKNQNRDEDDRKRYIDLYGLDYEDISYYDICIDTTGNTAETNFKKATEYIDRYDFKNRINKNNM